MFTTDGWGVFLEEQITGALENLISDENIDEEGLALIEKIKESIEMLKRFQEGDVPENEKAVLILQLEALQLEILDYSLKDRRKRISPEDLPNRLEMLGLLDAYKEWNEDLLKYGFTMDEVIKEDLMESKKLSYYYIGHFAVEGDHDDVVFCLSAKITEDGLTVGYWNSKFSVSYLGYYDENEPLRNPEGLEKVKSFLVKHKEFLQDECIEVCNDGCFQMHFKINSRPHFSSYTRGAFIKFAVLLDKELQRKYPFENIKGYEMRSQVKLAETIEDFEKFDPSKSYAYKQIRNSESLDHQDLLDLIIMSSYKITQEEVIEKFHEFSSALMAHKKKERDYKEQQGKKTTSRPYWVKIDGKEYSEEEYVALLVDEIRGMSIEEFENHKDQLFDL